MKILLITLLLTSCSMFSSNDNKPKLNHLEIKRNKVLKCIERLQPQEAPLKETAEVCRSLYIRGR